MEFDGKIHIRELEKKNVEVQGKAGESWISKVLERSAPSEDLIGLSPSEWAKKTESFETDLRVEKSGSDYIVTGSLKGRVLAPCSRCGDPFATDRDSNFQVVMHRLAKGSEKAQDDTGDPDYVFMTGDVIDLKEVVAEQLIVLEPVAECPMKDESSGKCRLCGKNPQFEASDEVLGSIKSPESAGQRIENSAFSALSQLAGLKQKNPDAKKKN